MTLLPPILLLCTRRYLTITPISVRLAHNALFRIAIVPHSAPSWSNNHVRTGPLPLTSPMPPQVPPINHLVWRHPIVLLMSSAADLHARLSTSSSGITNDSPLPHGDELSHITSSHDSLTSAAVPAPSSAPPAPPLPPSTPPPNPSLSDTTAELSDRLRHRLQQLAERRSSGRQQLRKVIFTPFTYVLILLPCLLSPRFLYMHVQIRSVACCIHRLG